MRQFLCLLYFCRCLDLDLFMSYLSSFSLLLTVQTREYRHTCCFVYFLECVLLFLDDNVDEECD